MQILIGISILVALALLASSKRFWSWRRTRLGAMLTTGGWIMVGVGFAIGQHGAGLVLPQHLYVVQPLILFCLGWIGMMVGMQLHRSIFKQMPGVIWKWMGMDTVLSILVLGGAAWGGMLAAQAIGADVSIGGTVAVVSLAVLIGICGIGWSQEVRSLRRRGVANVSAMTIVRATGALTSIVALLVYGLWMTMFSHTTVEGGVDVLEVLVGLGLSVLIAVTMGGMGYWLMQIAGKGEGEFLVVLIGLVSFIAGAGATLGYSPLFIAMLSGVMIVNLPGKVFARFRRVILDAEQPVAMALMLVAGVLAEPEIGLLGLGIFVFVFLGRIVVKHVLHRRPLENALQSKGVGEILDGCMRQSPLAIALAAGYAISSFGEGQGGGMTGGEVIMVVVLLGLASEVWPFMMDGIGGRGKKTVTEKSGVKNRDGEKSPDGGAIVEGQM